jgi:serine acetyltransferase
VNDFKRAQRPMDGRRALERDASSRHPPFVQALLADARLAAAGRGDPHEFRSRLDGILQALRLMLQTDAFLALAAYRAKASLRARGIPVLPWIAHRIAIMTGQVSIADTVVVHPGVFIPNGQVVIYGVVEIEPFVTLRPWVTVGTIGGGIAGPKIGWGAHIGTGAKVMGEIEVGAKARVGTNAVVLDDVPPETTVVGMPAGPVIEQPQPEEAQLPPQVTAPKKPPPVTQPTSEVVSAEQPATSPPKAVPAKAGPDLAKGPPTTTTQGDRIEAAPDVAKDSAVADARDGAGTTAIDVGAPQPQGAFPRERASLIEDWRNPFLLCLAGLVAASGTFLLVLESHLTFFGDEWEFLLNRRGWSVGVFLDPHNDHIALLPISIYKLLLAIFGMDSALPFQVVSTLVFLLSAVLLFVYVRRRVGDWLALLGSALILFLGAAWTDLLWSFQIGFSGSIAAGLGALLALDRDDRAGDGIACALLVISLSFSELGAPFVAGALVSVLVGEWPRIRRLYIVLVPLALYAAWWAGWGHTAESTFSLHNVLVSPKFVFDAASQAIASLLGLGTPLTGSGTNPVGLIWGRILLVCGIGAAIWRLRRIGEVPRALWVALAIGCSFWFLTAFNAVPLLRTPTSGRYQYPSAVFIVLIAAELLRGARMSRRSLAVASGIAALAVLSGVWFLHLGYSNHLKPQSDALRGQLAAIEIARNHLRPGLAVRSGLVAIDARSYLSAADAEGSPAYTPPELGLSPQAARFAADNLLVNALGIRLEKAQGSRPPPRNKGMSCHTVTATPTGVLVLLGPGKVTLTPRRDASTETVLLARFAAGFPVNLGRVVPGHRSGFTLPTDGALRPWRLGLSGSGDVTVCGQPAPAAPTGS